MKYTETTIKDNEGKEIVLKFRLTSSNAMALEDKFKKPVVEYLQEESMTMIITMLRYMLMWNEPNIGIQKASEIYDMLIENGWTYKKIIQDIIYETLVVSGFLEKSQWEEMKKETAEAVKKLNEMKKKALESIQNTYMTKDQKQGQDTMKCMIQTQMNL